MSFQDKYGPAALIAGGSEGVGASYATMLAERGLDLVLVARSPAPLEALAGDLRARFPDRRIDTHALDLTEPDTAARLAELTGDIEVGLLICNAGSNTRHAEFVDNSLDYAERLTALNALTPMRLCHHYGAAMKARGRGGIILNSSLASLVGNPHLAIYSAAKAYMNALGEALWHEMKPYGVDVLVHVLGSTDTPFIARNYPQAAGLGAAPDSVAADGLAALANGPLLRAPGGDQFHAMLAGMSRGDAVEAAHQAGKLFADA